MTKTIGIISSLHISRDMHMQSVRHPYIEAITHYIGAHALLIPAGMPPDILSRFDGLMLTGAFSNVHPSHYGQKPSAAHEPYDEGRDTTAMALARAAIAQNMPVLAICRGFQELNVACGGSLHAAVHEVAAEAGFATRMDHREVPNAKDDEERSHIRHAAIFPEGGYFHNLLGVREAQVNSRHSQAVDELGRDLHIEARAADGTIEAVRHTATHFCVGVQWHPEKQTGENIISERLFGAFGDAIV